MRIEHADKQQAKGWYFGPWNSDSQAAIGYANIGVDEPNYHQQIREIYLVACGEAQLRVEQQTFRLQCKAAQADKVPVERIRLGLA